MYRKAIEKAKRRLNVARVNAESLQALDDYEEFSEAWYVFLHAAKGIYTTLEQGAKATPQARQWFGRKNKERINDPMLRYISEARNDDEHGIEDGTAYKASNLSVGITANGYSNAVMDEHGNISWGNRRSAFSYTGFDPRKHKAPSFRSLDGKPIKTVFSPATVVLRTVHDRGRRPYKPPHEHLGKPLSIGDPFEVARLTILYLEQLVDEAETFCSL